ncbi:MAG: hypothetical protein CL609_03875 [Anaerolineaceae bacterium]|nr:hypothetical protein [Anaerolineaceae bacterium]
MHEKNSFLIGELNSSVYKEGKEISIEVSLILQEVHQLKGMKKLFGFYLIRKEQTSSYPLKVNVSLWNL